MAGVVPAFIFAVGLSLDCVRVWHGKRTGCDNGDARARGREIWAAFVAACPALLMPVIILGGIWSGIFTPTEAAAVAVVYGLFVSMVLYRDLQPARPAARCCSTSFTTSAVVMLVIGATGCLAWLITVEQVPVQIARAGDRTYATSQWMFLLLVNVALLLLGIFIEPLPALMLAAPLLLPLSAAFKIDPVHLGLIMTCNLAIGLYTPPVGGTLLVGARLAGVGMARRARADPADDDQRDDPVRDHLRAVDQHVAGACAPLTTFRPPIRVPRIPRSYAALRSHACSSLRSSSPSPPITPRPSWPPSSTMRAPR